MIKKIIPVLLILMNGSLSGEPESFQNNIVEQTQTVEGDSIEHKEKDFFFRFMLDMGYTNYYRANSNNPNGLISGGFRIHLGKKFENIILYSGFDFVAYDLAEGLIGPVPFSNLGPQMNVFSANNYTDNFVSPRIPLGIGYYFNKEKVFLSLSIDYGGIAGDIVVANDNSMLVFEAMIQKELWIKNGFGLGLALSLEYSYVWAATAIMPKNIINMSFAVTGTYY